MINREGLGYNAQCDSCSYDEDIDVDTFQEAVDEIKAQGWRISKTNEEWTHTCPDCLESEIKDLK